VIIPSMARTRRYMHGKRRRQCPASPFKHDHDREFSEQGKRFLASQKRRDENIASGTVVTQPISKYIEVTQNRLNALIRNGKGDTPQAQRLKDEISRLKSMKSNE
jgi:hypothetical protein